MSKFTDRLPLVTEDTIPDDIVFWDADDGAEELSHDELEGAVEYALDNIHPGPYPEELEIFGFRRMKLGDNDITAEGVLQDILERLDEEYGDPNGDDPYAAVSAAMSNAAERFVKVFRAKYVPWSCETACRIVIKTAPYLESTTKEQRK